MDILDQAIELEYRGHKMYLEAAERANNAAVKNILNSLADDELSHAEFLKGLKAGQVDEFKPTESMATIVNIIKESSISDPGFLKEDSSVLDVLKEALILEEQAASHYAGEATVSLDDKSVKLLNLLAKEEEHHFKLIENLIKYLDSPQLILETQEFQSYGE